MEISTTDHRRCSSCHGSHTEIIMDSGKRLTFALEILMKRIILVKCVMKSRFRLNDFNDGFWTETKLIATLQFSPIFCPFVQSFEGITLPVLYNPFQFFFCTL